ncbi:MAG: hydrogenase expression protein [Desulfuromonas sp.]|nr:MAG: hydrogenase expression protein [Desulfuromonas sp.]
MPNFLVLGLGNLLMNDDAAGLHAVYALRERFPEQANLQIVDGGTLGLDLLGYIDWADRLLILDAIDIDAPPGTVALIEGDDIDPVLERKVSPHQVGLKDLLAAAELIGDRPAEITLLGIQAGDINMAMELTPQVSQGMEKLVAEAAQRVAAFLESDG